MVRRKFRKISEHVLKPRAVLELEAHRAALRSEVEGAKRLFDMLRAEGASEAEVKKLGELRKRAASLTRRSASLARKGKGDPNMEPQIRAAWEAYNSKLLGHVSAAKRH